MEGVTISEVTLDTETSAVHIKDLLIENPELFNILQDLDQEKRVEYVKRSLYTGAVVLQVMDTTTRVDYVKSEFQRMQQEFDTELQKIFSDQGKLTTSLSPLCPASPISRQPSSQPRSRGPRPPGSRRRAPRPPSSSTDPTSPCTTHTRPQRR